MVNNVISKHAQPKTEKISVEDILNVTHDFKSIGFTMKLTHQYNKAPNFMSTHNCTVRLPNCYKW